MIQGQRVNFEKIEERVERLKEIPQRVEGIEFIVLFGSLATGELHPLSDIDMAFKVRDLDKEKRFRIWDLVTDLLETEEVDIVYVNRDMPARLLFQIASQGRLLYESEEGLFEDFQILAQSMWMEFKPYADYQDRVFLERIHTQGIGR